jgi:hypothetical protein
MKDKMKLTDFMFSRLEDIAESSWLSLDQKETKIHRVLLNYKNHGYAVDDALKTYKEYIARKRCYKHE